MKLSYSHVEEQENFFFFKFGILELKSPHIFIYTAYKTKFEGNKVHASMDHHIFSFTFSVSGTTSATTHQGTDYAIAANPHPATHVPPRHRPSDVANTHAVDPPLLT